MMSTTKQVGVAGNRFNISKINVAAKFWRKNNTCHYSVSASNFSGNRDHIKCSYTSILSNLLKSVQYLRNRQRESNDVTYSYLVETPIHWNLHHLSPNITVDKGIGCYNLQKMALSKNGMMICAFPDKLREAVGKTYTEHGGHIWVDHARTFGHSPDSYICPSNLTHLTNCNSPSFCYEFSFKSMNLSEVSLSRGQSSTKFRQCCHPSMRYV